MADVGTAITRQYQFRVRNLDPTRDVSDVLHSIQNLTVPMESYLSEHEAKLQLQVAREESIPVDPLTWIVIIEVVNLTAKPLLEGFFKKLGEKMADYLSDRVPNASILLQPSERDDDQPKD